MGKPAVVNDPSWKREAVAVGVMMICGLLAYANSFRCPFQMDDIGSIAQNPTIQPPLSWRVLWPRLGGETASGRPFFNLTLAANRVLHGMDVEGYHAGNLLCHLMAGLTLYALLRGTLALPGIPPWLAECGWGTSLAVALLWLLHPLQTAAVTYLSQRCEVLAGLFYLLTLLCLLRGHRSSRPGWWYAGCAISCFLGVASKEVAVSAPLVAFLYDRAFLTGSIREALRRRGWLYLALFLTWVPLGVFVAMTEGRGGSAGLSARVSVVSYFLAQPEWILHYLRLVFYPRPLVFDYGPLIAPLDGWGVAALVIVSALFLAAVVGCVRSPKLGVLGLGFFAALAPTSSVVPIATQTAAEHRMYLPLAVPLVLLAVAAVWVLARCRLPAGRGALAAAAVIALVYGSLTHLRNRDYTSPLELWTDNAAKAPANPRSWYAIGSILHERGDAAGAMEHYRRALDLAPLDPVPHYNIAVLHHDLGNPAAAEAGYRRALELNPGHTSAMLNLGSLLAARGEADEAVSLYEEAVRLMPRNPAAHLGLGAALGVKGDRDRAAESLRHAIRLAPHDAAAYRLLGTVLESAGRLGEAEQALREALPILTARDGATFTVLIRVLMRQGKEGEAERLVERAVRGPPGRLQTHATHWANLLALSPWNRAATPAIPVPPPRLVELAAHCRRELEFEASAAQLYDWAFAADPRLLEDRSRLQRFDAACAALRAGKGLGNDSYRIGKEHRLALARQGLNLLKAELADIVRLAQGGPRDRDAARRALLGWEKPRALPGDHEGAGADGLTAQEVADVRRLRAEAIALLQSLGGSSEP